MLHSWVWRRGGLLRALACMGGAALSCGGKAAGDPSLPGSTGKAPAATMPSAPGPAGRAPLTLPQPETCEDNPLLAGCASSPSPAPSLAPTPAPVAPAAGGNPSFSSPLGEVQQLLLDRCGECHGPATPELCGTCDGMYDIQDLRVMIRNGKVVPCHWQDSRLYWRVADGSMPPPGSGPGLTAAELRRLGDVVDGLCSELTVPGPNNPNGPGIERWLAADCAPATAPERTPEGVPSRAASTALATFRS